MQKTVFLCVAIYIVLTSSLYGNIDEHIRAIQNAPIEKRFKLMNAFKKELVKMKEQARIVALKKLTTHSTKKDASKVLEALKKHTAQQKARQQLEAQNIAIDNIGNETEDLNGGDNDDD
jgi:hypothetical protein